MCLSSQGEEDRGKGWVRGLGSRIDRIPQRAEKSGS
jgi:hypothetical protein